MKTLLAVAIATIGAVSVSYAAEAAVTLSFLSHDFGAEFPHAFVEVTGATDADPQARVQANYGFTAKNVGPAILRGPVEGELDTASESYVRSSDRHFFLNLSDSQYAGFLALVDHWRNLPGRSYDLHKQNCITFVGAVANFAGLRTEHVSRLMLKPRSFLDEVAFENPGRVQLYSSYRPKLRPPDAPTISYSTRP